MVFGSDKYWRQAMRKVATNGDERWQLAAGGDE